MNAIIPSMIPTTTAIITNTTEAMMYSTYPILPICARIALKLNASPNLSVRAKWMKAIETMNRRIMAHTTKIKNSNDEPPSAVISTLESPDKKAKIALKNKNSCNDNNWFCVN